jgi:FHA domain-containing protein
MTRDNHKNGADDLERLERALAEESKTSASLRDSLETLRQQVEQMSTSFEKRLGDARTRNQNVEAKFADQQARLEALGNGREETMRALADARAELKRLKIERDELLKQLARIDGMQSATVTLPDEDSTEEPGIHEQPPSLEELMASLGSIEEAGRGGNEGGGHLLKRVEEFDPDESLEMIAPELVFPEEYGGGANGGANGATNGGASPQRAANGSTSRVLVFLDADQPIKYPLYKEIMTIGRSEDADIQVNGDFVSRVHARLLSSQDGVVVEDVASKNGIKVNAKLIERHQLRHGDVLAVGRLRFTYIDTAAADFD